MISALISSVLPIAGEVIDRLVPDKNAAGKAKREMEKALVDAEAAGILVLQPIIVFGLALTETATPELPAFDMQSLMTILMGMLGLSGMRSFEKFKGLSK